MTERPASDAPSVAAPFDVDKALRRIVAEVAAVAKNPLAGADARTLAVSVSLLAVAVGRQEQRLRALEMCPVAHRAHSWTYLTDDPGAVCKHCRVPKGDAPG